MPFVKLDCGMLHSTLWLDRLAREVFITALLMAEPYQTDDPLPQIKVDTLENTGWDVPPGWYGFIQAAGVGILRQAGISDHDAGIEALRTLGEPDLSSRSQEFEGRRLVRVNGGYIALNYDKYRNRDYTAADRQRRYRLRKKDEESRVTSMTSRVTRRDVTQAEAEGEVEAKKQTKEQSVPVKPPPDPRIKEFLVWFQEEYKLRRNGAVFLVNWAKDGATVKRLLTAADLERLKTYATILLSDKTDDPFIVDSDRGIGVLAAKFNWLADRLAAWEARNGQRA